MRRSLTIALTAAITAGVVGTGAWVAGANATTRPVTVCVNKRTADVRFVSAYERCRRGENKVTTWVNSKPSPVRVDRLSTLVLVENGAVKKCTVRSYTRSTGVLAASCTTQVAPTGPATPTAQPSTSPSSSPSPSTSAGGWRVVQRP